MTGIYLFGTNNVTRILISYLKTDDRYSLLGITANKEYCTISEFLGFPVVPFADLASDTDSFGIVNCIGYSDNLRLRESIGEQILAKNIPLLSYIHPEAIADDVEFGPGCVVMARVVIEPYSKIGKHNVFCGGGYIGHDASIGDCNWFGAGCVFGGGVTMENRNFIGLNASIRDGIKIGSMNTVGMGAVVLQDVENRSVIRPLQTIKADTTR
jgi:sugar O-acyltransferase (sialic acid O-acetyltransferase NeuD family)